MAPSRILGGQQAREDVQDVASKFTAYHITLPSRPDLQRQTESELRVAELQAEAFVALDDFEVNAKRVVAVGNEEDASEDGRFSPEQVAILGPLAAMGARGNAAAHVELWSRCASGNKPFLIIEDGIKTWPRLGHVTAHLIATIERVVPEDERTVLLYLGGDVEPNDWQSQWLPTDMAHPPPIGKKIVLGELSAISGSFCYVVWPLAAKRLLGNLPIPMPIDKVIATHLKAQRVRALAVRPNALAVPVRDTYTAAAVSIM